MPELGRDITLPTPRISEHYAFRRGVTPCITWALCTMSVRTDSAVVKAAQEQKKTIGADEKILVTSRAKEMSRHAAGDKQIA